ncbi:MAG: threonine synthase, partial [Cyclobacteriaceae bacterium]|nr:threonine synthase [Cyclobacteriaceae bacterium]
MQFYSTNRKVPSVSFKEAVLKGLPNDNGLFLPEIIPHFSSEFLKELPGLTFHEIAREGARLIIEEEISEKDLKTIIEDAFNFDVPINNVHDNIHVLELFHGPTLAFKDFGARFMARVMGYFLKSDDREINILVATSGDTGSAVAQGFLGVEGIKITLLYPKGKVSKIQEQQLTTIGQNVTALEVDGTFDDCQHLVKTAFLDEELNKKFNLSSANSINIARLLPQSFYYTYAFSRLMNSSENIYFCVPSGNLGNLCGGLLAKKMGIPITGFIAASNANDIVPTYLETQKFSPKASIQTISNAMDVGNPSNFSRVLDLYDHDYQKIIDDIKGISFNDDETRTL